MQYHYVIGYDTELKKWFVEYDTQNYFLSGNIWNPDEWKYAENESEETIDSILISTLEHIVDTIPALQEV
jgi:hypothetical protein